MGQQPNRSCTAFHIALRSLHQWRNTDPNIPYTWHGCRRWSGMVGKSHYLRDPRWRSRLIARLIQFSYSLVNLLLPPVMHQDLVAEHHARIGAENSAVNRVDKTPVFMHIIFFKLGLILFSEVLGSQQNREDDTEIPHIPSTPTYM